MKKLYIERKRFLGLSTLIILIALAGAVISGFMVLVIPNQYAPVFVAGLFAGLVYLYFCFLRPVVPLYTALFFALLPSGMIQPESVHSMINRGLAVLALAAWIFGVIIHKEKIRFNATNILAFIFLTWAIASMLWTSHLSASFQQIQVYLLRVVIFLLIIPNLIRSKTSLNSLMGVIALDGLTLVLASVWIIATRGYTPGVRFTIMKVNENMIGMAALITLAGVLWHATYPGKHFGLRNLLAATFLLFTIGITALSGSRGSTISLIVTIGIFFFWKATRKWTLIAMVILVIAVLMFPAIFTTMVERFLLTQGDTLLNGREFTWQASWKVIEENPLFGVGIGGSRFAIIPYLSHLLSDQLSGAAVHNPILTLWSETGLIGLLLYLAIPFAAIRSFIQQYRRILIEKNEWITPYFAIITSISCGYFLSWYIGGGLQSDFTYFLILVYLILPSCLDDLTSNDHILTAANYQAN